MKFSNNNYTMKKIGIDISIDKWFDDVYQHVKRAISSKTGYCQEKSTLDPFNVFIGKMVECCWYDRFILEERFYCSKPDFTIYSNNSDGGVDFTILDTYVSVKCRSLEHNKSAYLDDQLITFNKQYSQAENIISKLINENKKCHFIVGAIRYKTLLYHDWINAWKHEDINSLNQITKYIFNNEMIWFSTEYNKIQIEING